MKKTTQLKPATKATPARSKLLTYAPEVEANRAAYERLAGAWLTIGEIESNEHGETATVDLRGPVTDGDMPVMRAFHQHFYALVFDDFNWFDERLMRDFYPEMRLAIDQLKWERRQAEGQPVS